MRILIDVIKAETLCANNIETMNLLGAKPFQRWNIFSNFIYNASSLLKLSTHLNT